jgi:hypothetical protein
MTFGEYVDARNDPRQPMGLWGPRGGPAYCRIDGARRPASTAKPMSPATQVSRSQAARDDVVTFRLEQHRKAAEADKVVARLRRVR